VRQQGIPTEGGPEGCWAVRRRPPAAAEAAGKDAGPFQSPAGSLLKHPLLGRLLKKAQVQGGARSEARGVLGPYVAAPRERANAADGAFSAAC
jgi:hypothetical protein